MKRDWLLYLVIFSLALNLGTIGTFAYLRYQDHRAPALGGPPPPLLMRELWGRLHLDDEQRQAWRRLLPEHRQRVWQLRGDLAQKREELFLLIKGGAPPWQPILAKIREISDLQGRLEEEVVRFLLEFQKHLKPEQKSAFLNLVERRLQPPRRPGFRRGPGKGLAPGGPDCPGPKSGACEFK